MPPKKRKDDFSDDSDVEEEQDSKKLKGAAANESSSEAEEEPTDFKLPAPTISGKLLLCGGTNWDLVGRSKVPKGVKDVGGPNLLGPQIFGALNDTPIRHIVSGCTSCHSVAIDTEGQAYTWGRNDKGQLGHGDCDRRDTPLIVDGLSGLNIITAACGKNHTLFLSDKGHVYAAGDNKMGQLGLGSQTASVPTPTRIQYKGPPLCRVACGAEFSMVSDINGNLYSFGCPEYGQVGHNTDGKYFVTSNKMAFSCETRPRKVQVFIEKSREGHISPVVDVEIQDIVCGVNHTVALDRKKRVFTWGFGGYGRLGHTDQKDEFVPRLVKFFDGPNRGVNKIAAGSSFSMGVNVLGQLYLWGKNKMTGEAAMYPKPVTDLSGWDVRSIGCCNFSIVLAADESIVSWGCAPTCGELAYGDTAPKSSPTPQEAKPFEGIYIQEVAAGYQHSLFIARSDSDEEKEKLKKLKIFTPQLATN